MEKLKENKKIIIGIIAILAVVAVIALVVIFVKPSYKAQIKKFDKACESEEKMEKFIKNNLNLRGLYALKKAEKPEDFEEEYKKAKKKDYTDKEFMDDIKSAYMTFTNLSKVEIKDIQKLKDAKDMGKAYEDSFGKIKGMKIARCTLKANFEGQTEEQEIDAIFYKGKLLVISPSLEKTYELQKQLEERQKDLDNMKKDLENESNILNNY